MDADKMKVPVLVRCTDSGYRVEVLGDIPPGCTLVTTDIDETRINKDLGASIGREDGYRYFRVIAHTHNGMSVSLEVPTERDSMNNHWYDIADGQVRPQRTLVYGPGFAFAVLPFSLACGLAVTLGFRRLLQPRLGPEASKGR